jgi:hypothetical protein
LETLKRYMIIVTDPDPAKRAFENDLSNLAPDALLPDAVAVGHTRWSSLALSRTRLSAGTRPDAGIRCEPLSAISYTVLHHCPLSPASR